MNLFHINDLLEYLYDSDFSRFENTSIELYTGNGKTGKNSALDLEQRTNEDLGGLDGTANKKNTVGQNNKNRGNDLDAADEHLLNKEITADVDSKKYSCQWKEWWLQGLIIIKRGYFETS